MCMSVLGTTMALCTGGFEESTLTVRGKHRLYLKDRKGTCVHESSMQAWNQDSEAWTEASTAMASRHVTSRHVTSRITGFIKIALKHGYKVSDERPVVCVLLLLHDIVVCCAVRCLLSHLHVPVLGVSCVLVW